MTRLWDWLSHESPVMRPIRTHLAARHRRRRRELLAMLARLEEVR